MNKFVWNKTLKQEETPKEVVPVKPVVKEEKTTSDKLPSEVTEMKKPALEFLPKKVPKKKFTISTTLMKRIHDESGVIKDFCPFNIYMTFIKREYKTLQTVPMLEGSYGETMTLGSGKMGEQVTDLPRDKRTGKKKIAQQRIDIQAVRFPILCLKNNISVIEGFNTQIPIVKKYDKALVSTYLDIFPSTITHYNDDTKEYQTSIAIIDLKFSGDVETEHGDYCWGTPEWMDHCQADFSHWLIRDFDIELNKVFFPEFEDEVGYKNIFTPALLSMIKNDQVKFFYFVLGYKKADLNKQVLLLERTYYDLTKAKNRPKEFTERLRKVIAELEFHHKKQWKPKPSNECKECPVSHKNGGSCLEYQKSNKV